MGALFSLAHGSLLSALDYLAALAILCPVACRAEWLPAYTAFFQNAGFHDLVVQILVGGQNDVSKPFAGQGAGKKLRAGRGFVIVQQQAITMLVVATGRFDQLVDFPALLVVDARGFRAVTLLPV